MTDQEISRATLHAILAAGVDYVLVGGLAVIAHTFPRTTMDVDFVVAVPMSSIDRIAQHFPAAFRLDSAAADGNPHRDVSLDRGGRGFDV